ncbi:MAG: hypothetical protein ISQ32_03965, partial [Rickettsiales bacterium]|nr:hypothetical protein [Rickettsiales bacterium]
MKENKDYNDTDRFIDDLTSQFDELSRLSNEDETGNQKLDAEHELPSEHEVGDELEQDNTSITSKLREIMRQVNLEYDQDQESD